MSDTITFYGKKSCISCQKAQQWLDQYQIPFHFLAIETNPPARDLLELALDAKNLKLSINTRSTAYKTKQLNEKLPAKSTLIDWMLAEPNLIKRPFLVAPNRLVLQGFDAEALEAFLKQNDLLT